MPGPAGTRAGGRAPGRGLRGILHARTLPFSSPTTTTARKLICLPPFTTLVTRLTCTTRSSNSFLRSSRPPSRRSSPSPPPRPRRPRRCRASPSSSSAMPRSARSAAAATGRAAAQRLPALGLQGAAPARAGNPSGRLLPRAAGWPGALRHAGECSVPSAIAPWGLVWGEWLLGAGRRGRALCQGLRPCAVDCLPGRPTSSQAASDELLWWSLS